ncbi:MAG: hypothetical protein Kow0027_21480 [Saprospiraceae bacterium]
MRNNTPGKDSIYYNALPFYQDRLDFSVIHEMMDGDFATWFRELWDERGKDVVLDVDPLHLDKIRRLYFQARNYEKTKGTRSLAIGFPVVIDTNESDLVFAPVFLQQLWLEPVLGNQHQWKIQVKPELPIQPNYRLLKHLKQKYGFDFEKAAKEIAENPSFDKIERFCIELGSKLHFEPKAYEGLLGCPGIDEIGQESEKGSLKWTAVMALFPPQDVVAPSQLARPEERFCSSQLSAPSFLPVPLNKEDLETANALEEVAKNKVVVVEELQNGAHRQLAVNLILNFLSEGKRILLVSPFTTSLVKTSEALSQVGLFQLHYLLDDPIHDAWPFLELVKTAGSGSRKEAAFDGQLFKVTKNKYQRASQEFSEQYKAARKPVFGEYSWSEVVGLWMHEKESNEQDLLGSHLNAKDFQFDFDEYEQLGKSVALCQELYRSVNTLNHPLTALNAHIFTEMNPDQALSYVSGKVDEKLKAAATLQKEIIGAITGYSQALRNKLDGIYRQLLKEANQLLKTHESFADRYGDVYVNSKKRPGSFSLFVSKKRKEVAEAMDVTSKLYRLFVRHFDENRLIEYDFDSCNGGYQVACVSKEIRTFVDQLKAWHKTLDEQVKDHTLRLNHKTADPVLDQSGRIRAVEEKLEQFISGLNEEELFQQPFENKTLTIPQRQKYLEYIIDILETIKLNIRDFQSFYKWQRNWLTMPESARKLISAIVKVKPKDWGSAYRQWYLNHVLLRNISEHQPGDELPTQEVNESWMVLKEMLLPALLEQWHGVQEQSKKQLRKSNSAYHKRLFGRKRPGGTRLPDLKDYFSNAFDCLTAYFPALLVTPHVARNILTGNDEKFDLIIFADSDRFSVEDAAAISDLGKQLVICGRKENIGTESSLISYAVDNEVPTIKLRGHLRKVSQSIFREGNVVGMPVVTSSYVAGRFDDLENTNLAEAQQVVKLLNQAKPNEKRVFPAIGVVAFTHEQRDLIQTHLLKIKQENSIGSEKILQLERNGLGVFCLDELYGQGFDELIVSCTYGPNDSAGTLTRKLAFLNTLENVQAIRCLIAQQANRITVLHSLPDNFVQSARVSDSEKGLYLLANLLTLADAQASGDNEYVREIQHKLGFVLPPNKHQSVFLQEVKNRLRAYMDADKIAFASMPPGLHKPLFVKPKFVIQQDAFFSRLENTFGPWEAAMQDAVKKMGMEFRVEWASLWFQEPKLQERLLASFILKKLDSEEMVPDKS